MCIKYSAWHPTSRKSSVIRHIATRQSIRPEGDHYGLTVPRDLHDLYQRDLLTCKLEFLWVEV